MLVQRSNSVQEVFAYFLIKFNSLIITLTLLYSRRQWFREGSRSGRGDRAGRPNHQLSTLRRSPFCHPERSEGSTRSDGIFLSRESLRVGHFERSPKHREGAVENVQALSAASMGAGLSPASLRWLYGALEGVQPMGAAHPPQGMAVALVVQPGTARFAVHRLEGDRRGQVVPGADGPAPSHLDRHARQHGRHGLQGKRRRVLDRHVSVSSPASKQQC